MTLGETVLIYGANGYTGRLITKEALKKGIKPVLCGRRPEPLEALAREHGLNFCVADLGDRHRTEEILEQASIVINCAGPFIHTASPLAQSCIKTRTHYLDITGEYEVFELLADLDLAAKDAAIMIMPGTGFDVVPSDCLAAHLKSRMADAVDLKLAFSGLGAGMSRGTLKTMIESLGEGVAIRKDHRIEKVPAAHKTMMVDFGQRKMLAAIISWGDVSSAYLSTGIPNIEVYMGVNQAMLRSMKMSDSIGWLLNRRSVKDVLKRMVNLQPAGPSEERRAQTHSLIWGRVAGPSGASATSLIKTPEGYTLTTMTVMATVKKILDNRYRTGFQTPSMAFGSDFILEIPGCERKDL